MSLSLSEHIKKLTYWQSYPEWYAYDNEDDENDMGHPTDKAPPEAIESYNYAMAWRKKCRRDGIVYN